MVAILSGVVLVGVVGWLRVESVVGRLIVVVGWVSVESGA